MQYCHSKDGSVQASEVDTRRHMVSLCLLLCALLCYPVLLHAAFYFSRDAREIASVVERPFEYSAAGLFLLLTFYVPAFAFRVASRRVGARLSRGELLVRRTAHLTFAAAPLYTATGVFLLIFDVINRDVIVWISGWLIFFAVFFVRLRLSLQTRWKPSRIRVPAGLGVVHGFCAALLIVVFLTGPVINHLTALFAPDFNNATMLGLRHWYKSAVVQPALLVGLIFIIGSGIVLARFRTCESTDKLDVLQTLTGGYLVAFLMLHMSAVLFGARWNSGMDTVWLYAINAPAGLVLDSWSVRLIPHYALAVWALITHAGCGLRTMLLNLGVSVLPANRTAVIISVLGASNSALFIGAMFGVRLS